MLSILAVSGETVSSLTKDQFRQLVSDQGSSVRALKNHLQSVVGLPRFRQRILDHLGLELQDDVDLQMHFPCCLQLVKLSFDEEATCENHSKLLQAVEQNDTDRMEPLLRKPVNPDHRCPKHSRSAMQTAIQCGRVQAVQMLIEAGSDLNGAPYRYLGYEPKFKCVEHEATGTPLFQACEGRAYCLVVRHKIISALIQGRADTAVTNSFGKTPLRKACDMHDVKLLRLLIDLRADPSLARPEAPVCAVVRNYIRSSYSNPYAIIETLLVARASLSHCGPIEDSPVYLATQRYSSLENLKLLLKWRADLNAVDVETGETALIRACSEGDILRVKKLVGMRANVRKADATGATPLHVVCGETKLMEPSWDNRDLRNSVCEETHLEIVKLLVEARANIDACMKDGTTALQLAVQHQKETIASFLKKRKADDAMASSDVFSPRRAVLLLSRGDRRPRAG